MTALNILWTYIRRKKGLLLPALFANVLDSITNALLLISIGKGFSLMMQSASTKSQLFDAWLVPVNDFNEWTTVFFALLLLKVISTFVDYWLNQRASESFVKFIRKAQLFGWKNASEVSAWKASTNAWKEGIEHDHHNLRKLISSGLLEAVADFTYLLLLFFLFFSIEASLMWTLLAFVPVYAFTAWILGRWTSATKRNRSTHRQRLKETEQAVHRSAASHLSLNRSNAWVKLWGRSAHKHQEADDRWSVAKAASEAITPLLFFSMLFAVLWRMHSEGLLKEESFSFILLLIYAQGSLRRSMRVPAVWINGLHSLKKLNVLSFDETEEPTKTSLHVESLQMKTSRTVELTLRAAHHIITQNAAQRGDIVHAFILGTTTESTGLHLLLNGATHDAATTRRYIGVVSTEMDLSGDSLEEALFVGNKPERAEKLKQLLSDLQLAAPSSWSAPSSLSVFETYQWQIVRLILHDRKVLLLDDPYAHFNSTEAAAFDAFLLNVMRDRTILILSEKNLSTTLPLQIHSV